MPNYMSYWDDEHNGVASISLKGYISKPYLFEQLLSADFSLMFCLFCLQVYTEVEKNRQDP